MIRISEYITPTPEVVAEVKQSYNRVIKRLQEAVKYLDNSQIPSYEKENRIIVFQVEVLEVLGNYLQILRNWGLDPTSEEIIEGFMEIN